jgi:hypothetical protein
VLRTFHPELTELQRQVLDLLDIHTSVYSPVTCRVGRWRGGVWCDR